MSGKKKFKGLYRTKKYGTWKPFEIELICETNDMTLIKEKIEIETGEIPVQVQLK